MGEDIEELISISVVGSLPGWLTLTSTGSTTAELAGIPLEVDVGSFDMTLRADSSSGATLDQTFGVVVGSGAPEITSIPVTDVFIGENYTYLVTAFDPNQVDLLSIEAVSVLPSWLVLNDNNDGTATLSGTPGSADVDANVTLRVTDSANLTAEQSFTISVTSILTDPPPPPPAFCTQDLSRRAIAFDIIRSGEFNFPDGSRKSNYEDVWDAWPGNGETHALIPKGSFLSLPFVAKEFGQYWSMLWVDGPINGNGVTVTISSCPGDFDLATLSPQSCAVQSGGQRIFDLCPRGFIRGVLRFD